MPLSARWAISFYQDAIADYHAQSDLDAVCPKPSLADSLSEDFYAKAWIDTVQWHLEDEIHRSDLSGEKVLTLKRRIDALNHARTDAVEHLDKALQKRLSPSSLVKDAEARTESLGWALDRLCILQLKRYHMKIEVERSEGDYAKAAQRYAVLEAQNTELSEAIDILIEDLQTGKVRYQLYAQHKLYNDPDTNPALYGVK